MVYKGQASRIVSRRLPVFSDAYTIMSTATKFASANLDEVVDALTQEEAISLIAGYGMWHTAPIPRLGIPALKVGL